MEIVDTWVVYDRGPAMMPGLTYAADGNLLVTFETNSDGLPGGEMYLMRSPDHGRTWSGPERLARSRKPNGSIGGGIGLTMLRGGALLRPLVDTVNRNGFDERDATLYILRSSDNGKTWEGWEPVATDIHEPFSYGQIVESPEGTLLCPIWGRYRRDERWRSALLFSYDRGRTWGDYTTIAFDPEACLAGEYARPQVTGYDAQGRYDPHAIRQPTFRPHSTVDGFNETSIIPLSDGRLLAILRQQGVERTQRLYFYRAISEDEGQTWSPYQRTNLCGMSPCLHRSPRGQLLLAYRRCAPDEEAGATPGLSIARIHDDGLTWEELLTLREPKGFRYTSEYQVGYPAMVNTPDSHILVIYYSYDEALPHRRYLAANLIREGSS